ncbi:MAG: S-methyl-5-thioribose-1-phosphate isomerase [Chloroflexi bacterium]|nr:S-methyl-5-thioribose-1-phosphate isomerase [Chloroflexota bacterium]
MRTVDFHAHTVVLIDQTRLPAEEVFLHCTTWQEVAEAIRSMRVRGAPAIGVAAAGGVALAALQADASDPARFQAQVEAAIDALGQTRPTAVNLFWALEQARDLLANTEEHGPLATRDALAALARHLADEDVQACRRIGGFGGELIPERANVLTHCNAGALACVDYGTALGVIRGAVEQGKQVHVFVDETRPFLQGARLTAWELQRDAIPLTVITDNMAGYLMSRGEVDVIVVGADRIAANGDVANKIGTYTLGVLAREHNIPFFVAAPVSTVDLSLASGAEIPIEERSADEVVTLNGQRIAPLGAAARHPAFDVTPARLVTAIVTDRGVARPPYDQSLPRLTRNPLRSAVSPC